MFNENLTAVRNESIEVSHEQFGSGVVRLNQRINYARLTGGGNVVADVEFNGVLRIVLASSLDHPEIARDARKLQAERDVVLPWMTPKNLAEVEWMLKWYSPSRPCSKQRREKLNGLRILFGGKRA